MKNSLQVLSNIDYTLLRQQKGVLLDRLDAIEKDDAEGAKAFEGLLILLDNIQDAIVKDGFRTEEEVFGEYNEETGEYAHNEMTVRTAVEALSHEEFQVKVHDVDDGVEYVNFYRCPECGNEWEDTWTSTCDDFCGSCGIKNISPYKSEEVAK